MSPIILQLSLDDLKNKTINVSPKATDGRFRLVNCKAFRDPPGELQVEEFSFDDMPKIRYAAISYPWKGVGVGTRPVLPTFNVKDAEDGDPISIDVVRSACIAAIQGGAEYIWLDRLCILQAKARKTDKQAQIEHMHEVYSCCELCIVIPGGLERYVSLDEETPWILRSWTLQEVLSPKTRKVKVLIEWKLGSCMFPREGAVREVDEKRTATIALWKLLDDTSEGSMEFVKKGTPYSPDDNPRNLATCFIRPNIFHHGSSHARALVAAMATGTPQDFKDNAIWQCSQLRTSSRPVDMVLSIMGMFGVTLTTKYEPHERLRATIDLAKEILKKGRSASWLGASFRLPPCKYISTFSLFPETQVKGGALIKTPSGSQDISNFVGGENLSAETITALGCLTPSAASNVFTAGIKYLLNLAERIPRWDEAAISEAELLPRGSMDDEGYLEIEVRSHPVRPKKSKTNFLHAVDRTWWEAFGSTDQDDHEFYHFAIFLGVYKKYHEREGYNSFPAPGDRNFGKFMIVERHDAKLQRFHTVTFGVNGDMLALGKLEWKKRKFRIGGPEPLPKEGEMVEHQVVDYEPELASTMQMDFSELQDLSWRLKGRPQKEVEEYFEIHPEADKFPHDGLVKCILNEGKNKLKRRSS
ncbi:hypothetical protein OG21DRAFT_1473297 [Imleria badia]|nr:hypothetical protein OG21DRAFT_1473297 [Imleria badia]